MIQENTSTKLAAYMQAEADVNNFSGTVLIMKNGAILLKKADSISIHMLFSHTSVLTMGFKEYISPALDRILKYT